MQLETSDNAAKAGDGDTYNMVATWSRTNDDATPFTANMTSLWLQDYVAWGCYVSTEEFGDFAPFFNIEDDEATRYLWGGTHIWQASLDDENAHYQISSTYEADDDPEFPRYQFLHANGFADGSFYGDNFHSFAEVDGSPIYGSSSAQAPVMRIWPLPGNTRIGSNAGWSYQEEDPPGPTSGDIGRLGGFAVLDGSGTVYSSPGTSTGVDFERRLTVYGVTNEAGTYSVSTQYEANPAALGFPGDTQFHGAAYSHTGEADGVGNAIRQFYFALHDFPLSLCPEPVTVGEIEYEPDAIDQGQAVDPFYMAAPLAEWNQLAHPHLEPEDITTDTRWCYHWVGVGDKLYPMVTIDAAGVWRPRQPPRGEYYDSEGVLQHAYSLGWDNSPDAKHPSGADWPT
jgi:hypothetical protein